MDVSWTPFILYSKTATVVSLQNAKHIHTNSNVLQASSCSLKCKSLRENNGKRLEFITHPGSHGVSWVPGRIGGRSNANDPSGWTILALHGLLGDQRDRLSHRLAPPRVSYNFRSVSTHGKNTQAADLNPISWCNLMHAAYPVWSWQHAERWKPIYNCCGYCRLLPSPVSSNVSLSASGERDLCFHCWQALQSQNHLAARARV